VERRAAARSDVELREERALIIREAVPAEFAGLAMLNAHAIAGPVIVSDLGGKLVTRLIGAWWAAGGSLIAWPARFMK